MPAAEVVATEDDIFSIEEHVEKLSVLFIFRSEIVNGVLSGHHLTHRRRHS